MMTNVLTRRVRTVHIALIRRAATSVSARKDCVAIPTKENAFWNQDPSRVNADRMRIVHRIWPARREHVSVRASICSVARMLSVRLRIIMRGADVVSDSARDGMAIVCLVSR